MQSKWQKTTLGEFVNINPRRSVKKGTVTPFVGMPDITENIRDIRVIGEREFGSGMKFQDGDTLFARITPCLENGKTVLVNGLGEGVIAHGSTEFIVLSPKDIEHDAKFIYYLARLPEFREFARSRMEGTSGRQRVDATALASYEFMLPPPDIRKGIGEALSAFDDKMIANSQMNQTLEKIAQRIFKSWFIDFDPVKANAEGVPFNGLSPEIQALFPNKLVDSGTEFGLIPEGWKVSTIEKEIRTVGGATPSTTNADFWDDGSIRWTTPKDLSGLQDKILIDTARRITPKGLEKISSGLLPKNTVLMSSRAPVGYLALAREEMAINQGYIAMICQKDIQPFFMLQWLDSNMDKIKRHAGGTTFAEISKGTFRPMELIVPFKKCINVYEKQVESIYKKIELNVRQNMSLAQVRDRLLPELLSGKIQLSDAKQELKEAV